ncbi:hypothetical protein V6N11_043637 [Hibiscus sabdariffa]|uniref:Uncharacterized protein n=1 Tax=Hibiscus sabdariffa TaxID=183260 RepID=A0ABR2RCT5_9ROSI
MEMDQAQLVYCSFEIDCQCFYFFYKGALIFCFDWMTKGMSRLETTGPAWADYLVFDFDSVSAFFLIRSSNRVIEKNMLMKLRSLSILRFTAGAGKSGPKLCLNKFWAFMLQVASVQLFTTTILLLSYSARDIEKNMLMKMRSLSILHFSTGAGKSGPILCLSKFWAFMLQVASVQLFTATILLLSYSAWLIIPGMNPEKHK